jgi:hypothetical protein
MSSNWAVFAEGDLSQSLRELSADRIAKLRAMAVNTTARHGRAVLARDIRDQVNLPARYVSESEKRLYVAKTATAARAEAVVRASGRPTSLARYAVNPSTSQRGAGVLVEVAPGRARLMRKAFFLRLPQGSVLTDTQFNLGLAIRLRPGERVMNKVQMVRMSSGLYLLYGPSVDQVFRANDGSGAASDRAEYLARKLEDEFLRLLEL